MNEEEKLLKQLEYKFLEAIQACQNDDLDKAERINKAILEIEPRLVEPNIELATIAIRREQFEIAQVYAEEGVRLCGLHGHWMDNFTDHELLSLSYCTLGESLRFQAQNDKVIFEEPERFATLMKEARTAYKKAAEVDPDNEFAVYWGKQDSKWDAEG
jgi:tetratricopeptide (TPR) repeat protein